MDDYKEKVLGILDSYKCKSPADELKMIPIQTENGLVGFLRPVTYLYGQISSEYVSLICNWRNENPIGFANSFKNTIIKTENWLDKIYLPRQDRILFMIHPLNHMSMGHLGLSNFNFEKQSCEIDNVVRGEKYFYKGYMTFAMNTIVEWAKKILNIKDFYLRVLIENTHAIEFYTRLGFKKQNIIPLYRVEKVDIIEWVEMENAQGLVPEKYYVHMKLWK